MDLGVSRKSSAVGRRSINRAPSPVLAFAAPWLFVMLGSLSPTWPLIASAPILPPLGFLALVAWQQLRPGLFPVWAGVPLGLFDDLYSGQPFGSAILLWSIAMIGLDLLESRVPWRGVVQNWLVGVLVIIAYLLIGLAFANAAGGSAPARVMIPQMVVAALIFPLVARLVAIVDRFRLVPIRVV